MPSLRLAYRLHLVTVVWLRPLTADSAIAGALLCHQGRRPQSLCAGSLAGAGHLHSMWLKPSPDCRGLNFVTSLFLTRTLPWARRHGLSSWAGPLLLVHSGDIFRLWVTFPCPSI